MVYEDGSASNKARRKRRIIPCAAVDVTVFSQFQTVSGRWVVSLSLTGSTFQTVPYYGLPSAMLATQSCHDADDGGAIKLDKIFQQHELQCLTLAAIAADTSSVPFPVSLFPASRSLRVVIPPPSPSLWK